MPTWASEHNADLIQPFHRTAPFLARFDWQLNLEGRRPDRERDGARVTDDDGLRKLMAHKASRSRFDDDRCPGPGLERLDAPSNPSTRGVRASWEYSSSTGSHPQKQGVETKSGKTS